MTVYAAEDMNLRTGPGTEYDCIRTLNAGDAIDVVAITDNGWYRTYSGNYVLIELTTTEPVATTTLPEQTTWTDEEPATTTSYEENPYEETEPSATYPDFPSDSDASYWVNSNANADGTIDMTAALSYSNYYDMGNAYSNGYYTLSFSDSRVVIRYDDIFYERYIGGDYYCATNNGVYSMSREDIEALYRFVSGGTTNGFDRI